MKIRNEENISLFPELGEAIDLFWQSRGGSFGDTLAELLSVTAQPYVELMAQSDSLDKEDAIRAGLEEFRHYAANQRGTLFWRETPYIRKTKVKRRWFYEVTATLLISDNPIVTRLTAYSTPHFSGEFTT